MPLKCWAGPEAVFDTTLEYLKERKQFGVIIGTFPSIETPRGGNVLRSGNLPLRGAGSLSALDERRNDVPAVTSLAKARVGEAARLITNEGVQMHGGIGMTDAVDMGLYLKRARVQAQMLGDSNFHRARYADLGGY